MTDKATGIASTPEEVLIEELARIFWDWERDFEVTLDQSDQEEGNAYFDVSIEHRFLGREYFFVARVDENLDCQMDFADLDNWHGLSAASVWSFMWFEEAEPKEKGADHD